MTSDYRPIVCGLYAPFEPLARRAELIELELIDARGAFAVPNRPRPRPAIRGGAESLDVEDETGRCHGLGLDRLSPPRSRPSDWQGRQDFDETGKAA